MTTPRVTSIEWTRWFVRIAISPLAGGRAQNLSVLSVFSIVLAHSRERGAARANLFPISGVKLFYRRQQRPTSTDSDSFSERAVYVSHLCWHCRVRVLDPFLPNAGARLRGCRPDRGAHRLSGKRACSVPNAEGCKAGRLR